MARADVGTERMAEIAGFIQEGAMAFLGQEYRVLAIFVVVVAALLVGAYWTRGTQLVALSFAVGAGCSGLAGYFGMRVATLANVRTTAAARRSLNAGLMVAFSARRPSPIAKAMCSLITKPSRLSRYRSPPRLAGSPTTYVMYSGTKMPSTEKSQLPVPRSPATCQLS